MIKLKDLLKEDYAVNVQDTRKNKQIQSGKFTFKDDANKYIKDMVKKHKLKRQKGFWANPKTGVELITNFQENIMIKLKDIFKESDMNINEDTAAQYEKLRKNFEKTYKAYWDAVYDYEQGLKKQGLKKEAMTVHRKYMKNVLGFHAWMRQLIRKVF